MNNYEGNNHNDNYYNYCILNKIDIQHLYILIRTKNGYSSLNFDNVDKMIEVFDSKKQAYISKNKI